MAARKKSSRTPQRRGEFGGMKKAKRDATGVSPVQAGPLIVGIGASAGGLEAFKTFFSHMQADSGMAFVVVQHLAPERASMLVELLRPHTAMPVAPASDGVRVEANSIYVIPPNAVLTLKGGKLHVTAPAPPRAHRWPIDTFFASLAEDQGERAACIILSGVGSDGTAGLRSVKEHGGLTMAQADFEDHALSGMPSSAAATGLVDEVMPVENMPKRLMAHAAHLTAIWTRDGHDGAGANVAVQLPKIFALMRRTVGHDFGEYKQSTLVRRIRRRMQVRQIDSEADYLRYLEKEPRELELLFQEFLISVTDFFRDPAAFKALGNALKDTVKQKGRDDTIRVWVPACATGEEAYSIAILLKELVAKRPDAPRIQLFATDIDARAIAVARAGRYSESALGHVSAERRKRWFAKDGNQYCPVKEIRELCIFSTHSVLKDPPFSKLDLVSCRNLLIYFDAALQDRVVRTFHYALARDGLLFVGNSEGVGRHARLFTVVDRKHRIYQRRGAELIAMPRLPAQASRPAAKPSVEHHPSPPPQENNIEKQARRVMERHVPAYVVVGRDHDILRFSGNTESYLGPSPGAASLNLFNLLRKPLVRDVRAVLQKAFDSQRSVIQENVVVKREGMRRLVDLIVEPIGEGHYVLGFAEHAFVAGGNEPPAAEAANDGLEKELHETRERLQGAIDDLETGNEELRSSNEEYESVNEELQSANEELETAKEEMQSINEELQTLNAELNGRNEQLADLNSELTNLKNSTHIATLFVDGKMNIRDFTPAMTSLFHLREQDRGRPVTDIASRLSYDRLSDDAAKVMRTLSVVEREVVLEETRTIFLMRIWPYVTVDKVVDGFTITFVNITEQKRHEMQLAALAAIVDSAEDAILSKDLNGIVVSWNRGAERCFGYTAQEIIGEPESILVLPERRAEEAAIFERVRRGERMELFDTVRRRKDGSTIPISLTVSPVKNAGGAIIGASSVAREMQQRTRK